ncbi:GNAT family N-acetyltransferase [Sinomicrobium weinanense]|uniref:GNAT family N-acetyltransferase n=1 Tax=Sinomicrobium weinanense TaxID=2842200 RepID=A0A926Q4Y1_9FLAO|nr:GNAT family N-acetyltransferase [Sinomicrobium weinanense]MBC9797380.1 GNAT family N-acetyltransferase [Sinomicrobium weinanense]MBU3123389.1 GNAT family N-acetyltransferase [Sinomicrobium weinanense]
MEKPDEREVNSGIKVVPCTPADIDTIIQTGRLSYKQHYLHIWKDKGSFYMKKSFSRKTVESEFENPNFRYFLIRRRGKPVGILKLVRDNALAGYSASEALEVEKIYIIREAAGKGTGTKVMEFVKDYARMSGKKVIWLNVMDTSPAQAFYKKAGFEPAFCYTINVLDFPPIKEEYRAMTRMKLRL